MGKRPPPGRDSGRTNAESEMPLAKIGAGVESLWQQMPRMRAGFAHRPFDLAHHAEPNLAFAQSIAEGGSAP